MKAPNGYGGITKLSGNRRRPFRVRLTDGWDVTEDGKLKQKFVTLGYFATRKEAMLALAQYNQSPYDLANQNMTFEQCFEAWIPAHMEKFPKSAKQYIGIFKHCSSIKDMPIRDIRLKHLQDIADEFANKSTNYQAKLKTVFTSTFKYALENDIVIKDYSQFVKTTSVEPKKEGQEKLIDDSQIKQILANVNWEAEIPEGRTIKHKMKLVDSVITLLYTGCRIEELLSIKSEDVHIEERYIDVMGTKTKAAKRVVPIHKELIPILKARLAEGGEYLFSMPSGERIPQQRYRRYFWEPYMEAFSFNHTPHDTRHTFISKMDKCGVSSAAVVLKRIVGHSNDSITEHYTHKDLGELIAAIDKYKLL